MLGCGNASPAPGGDACSESLHTPLQINDVNYDGLMDADELEDAMLSIGIPFASQANGMGLDIEEVFGRLDADKDGRITFDEFYAWYSSGVDFEEIARNETAFLFAPTAADERKVRAL